VIKTGTAVGAEPVGDVWTGRCVGSTASTTKRGPACRKVGRSAAPCSLMRATRPVQQVSASGCVNGHVHEARRCTSWPTDFRKKGVHGNESCVPCVPLLCFLLDVIDQRTHKGQGFGVKWCCELSKSVLERPICVDRKLADSRKKKVVECNIEGNSFSLLRIRINHNNQKRQGVHRTLRTCVGVDPLFRPLTRCNAARLVLVR
jgi:hypothetical protein